jgi:hypothetical protein
VRFDAPHDGRDEWRSWLSLSLEAANEITPLLTLAWVDSEPEAARGLNSAADVREGVYAKGNVVNALRSDLRSALQGVAIHTSRAVALRPASDLSRTEHVSASEPRKHRATPHRIGNRASKAPLDAGDIEVQRANVSELLISRLMKAMQSDLGDAESHFAGAGIAASAKQNIRAAVEWAMLGTGAAVEVKSNQLAMSSFLERMSQIAGLSAAGSQATAWCFSLVGPVLIGGMAYLSMSKWGKGSAYALMATWALAAAGVTATMNVDAAQEYFPKRETVIRHQQALAVARLHEGVADGELIRLNAPLKEASELVAAVRKRWQAKEIQAAAEHEKERRELERAAAREALTRARIAVKGEEQALRQAILEDPSRAWAWRTLFAIFGVVNLAGPLAVSRVLEKWRGDHDEAEASAKEDHKKKSEATFLRGRRAAQRAHAMSLLPALLDDLRRDGVAPEILAGLDLGGISQKAAERFDHAVNGKRVARRLFGFGRSAEGPG